MRQIYEEMANLTETFIVSGEQFTIINTSNIY